MTTYGLDVECPHKFDGTHFARWRNWISCNFKFISPQLWWIVDVGFSCAIDRKVATEAQKKCLYLDWQAINIFYRSIDLNIFKEIMKLKSAHEIWVFLNEKYEEDLKIVEDDKLHEMDDGIDGDLGNVEPIDDIVDNDGCSTPRSSCDNEDATTSKIDDNTTSDAHDDSTSPSTSTHGHMDDSDMEVNDNVGVIDHSYTYDELVGILKGMTIIVENLETKVTNLENENLTLKNSRKHTECLLDTFVCKLETLKVKHEALCQNYEKLEKTIIFSL
jgi:hypothetical protein